MASFFPEIGFYLNALKLKDLLRTGWVLRKVKKPETVASHLWGIALLSLMYSKRLGYNESKCFKLALLHDLMETITGDIPTTKEFHLTKNAFKKKLQNEKTALNKLIQKIYNKKLRKEFHSICLDYIEKRSPEAKFVSDLDKIEMCLQALYYAQNKRTSLDLLEFFETSYARLYTPEGRELLGHALAEFLNTNYNNTIQRGGLGIKGSDF